MLGVPFGCSMSLILQPPRRCDVGIPGGVNHHFKANFILQNNTWERGIGNLEHSYWLADSDVIHRFYYRQKACKLKPANLFQKKQLYLQQQHPQLFSWCFTRLSASFPSIGSPAAGLPASLGITSPSRSLSSSSLPETRTSGSRTILDRQASVSRHLHQAHANASSIAEHAPFPGWSPGRREICTLPQHASMAIILLLIGQGGHKYSYLSITVISHCCQRYQWQILSAERNHNYTENPMNK